MGCRVSVCQPTATGLPAGYSLHQLQGNKAHGVEKKGHLLKKSENRMVRTWQRRRCAIKQGALFIYHQDVSRHRLVGQ